jgi:hypothetical protein
MTTTPAPATSKLDTVLGKIDELLGAAAPVSMTSAQFNEHVAAELEKALADAAAGKAEAQKARLTHLKAQVAAAKAVYDSGATLAQIEMFKDPWQQMPGESSSKTADVPQPAITPTGDSNVQFKDDVIFVETEKGRGLSDLFKGLYVVAKATDAAPARKKLLAKGADGVTIIAKAGEALACLTKIAAIFGYVPEGDGTLLDYDFRYSVEDTVRALQSAAKTETVIAQMTSLLGEPAAKAALLTPATAPAAPPAPPAAPPAIATSGEDGGLGWPLDMTTAVFDEKTETMKSAGADLYWGRDSQKAPTT